MKNREEMGAHPGWAIRFSNGAWLGGAHGWWTSMESFYADVFDSEEEAKSTLKYVRDNYKDDSDFHLAAEIIPAWEQLCESLRVEVRSLREANTISPDDISDAIDSLEDVIRTLKPPKKKL